MTLAQTIKAKRKELSLTQNALARKCGTNQFIISRFETGKEVPKGDQLNKLQSILGFIVTNNKILTTKKTMLNPFTISELIALRKKYNVKQGQLAEAIGVHYTTISKAEKGIRNLGEENKKAIIKFFTHLSNPEHPDQTQELLVMHSSKAEKPKPVRKVMVKGKRTKEFDPTTFKSKREKLGFTQGELGEKIGVGQSAIANWENARAKPSEYFLKRVNEIFAKEETTRKTAQDTVDLHLRFLKNGTFLSSEEREVREVIRPVKEDRGLETKEEWEYEPSLGGFDEAGKMQDWIPANMKENLDMERTTPIADFVTIDNGQITLHQFDENTKSTSLSSLYQEKILKEKESELENSQKELEGMKEELQELIENYKIKLDGLNKTTETIPQTGWKLVVPDPTVPTVKLSEVSEDKFYGLLNTHNLKGYVMRQIKGGAFVVIGLMGGDLSKYETMKELVEHFVKESKTRVYQFETFAELATWFSN